MRCKACFMHQCGCPKVASPATTLPDDDQLSRHGPAADTLHRTKQISSRESKEMVRRSEVEAEVLRMRLQRLETHRRIEQEQEDLRIQEDADEDAAWQSAKKAAEDAAVEVETRIAAWTEELIAQYPEKLARLAAEKQAAEDTLAVAQAAAAVAHASGDADALAAAHHPLVAAMAAADAAADAMPGHTVQAAKVSAVDLQHRITVVGREIQLRDTKRAFDSVTDKMVELLRALKTRYYELKGQRFPTMIVSWGHFGKHLCGYFEVPYDATTLQLKQQIEMTEDDYTCDQIQLIFNNHQLCDEEQVCRDCGVRDADRLFCVLAPRADGSLASPSKEERNQTLMSLTPPKSAEKLLKIEADRLGAEAGRLNATVTDLSNAQWVLNSPIIGLDHTMHFNDGRF